MIEAVLSVVGAGLLGVIAWAVQLSNKVAVVEADLASLQDRILDRIVMMDTRLERIERKVLNGNHYER